MKLVNFFKKMILLSALAGSFSVQASVGTITVLLAGGPNDPNHPDIVQISLTAGVNASAPSCNASFAAVRNTAENQHLISMLLTAFASNKTVDIVLDSSDRYFGDRCAVSRVSVIR